MKKIYQDKILNIEGTNIFDQKFLIEYIQNPRIKNTEVIFLSEELQSYKNEAILQKLWDKPAMWSEVYSPKDELSIFTRLFEEALSQKKKIHIVGVTLGAEIEILEKYYEELGFLRTDINAFDIDFSVPLVTVSCHIENLMWRGSDYKSYREKIFFCPPIRESGENKALFKGISRGVIAGIELWEMNPVKEEFLTDCVIQEHILPIQMGKVLKYNLQQIGFEGSISELQIFY
jgi:dihydroorotase-like cyclic amidohydrolase